MKKYEIKKITPGSIADEMGIVEGDLLMTVNEHSITDIIDYLFLTSDEYVELEIESHVTGEVVIYEVEKEFDEDIGISFKNPLLDEARNCSNNCIFCFVDQLPQGMRKSLYFKDDDSRLSFMQGNFVTLTNVNYDQIERIIRYRISPINVSVHTTDPQLRIEILRNRYAGDILEKMNLLADGNIEMNAQIVLMPGINDGKYLQRTIADLSKLHPQVESIAIVPIGLSRFRKNLTQLSTFTKKQSQDLIIQIDEIQNKMLEKHGTRFVFLSDEFYIVAENAIPNNDFYENYIQLENGVGLLRKFYDEIAINRNLFTTRLNKKYLMLTGTIAGEWLNRIIEDFELDGLEVRTITNRFFGEKITVSGLITATDIMDQIKDSSSYEGIIIPDVMLKSDEDIFLDDITLSELESHMGVKIHKIPVEGVGFLKLLEELK